MRGPSGRTRVNSSHGTTEAATVPAVVKVRQLAGRSPSTRRSIHYRLRIGNGRGFCVDGVRLTGLASRLHHGFDSHWAFSGWPS